MVTNRGYLAGGKPAKPCAARDSGFRTETVRSEGRSSRTPVQQALIYLLSMSQNPETTRFPGFLRLLSRVAKTCQFVTLPDRKLWENELKSELIFAHKLSSLGKYPAHCVHSGLGIFCLREFQLWRSGLKLKKKSSNCGVQATFLMTFCCTEIHWHLRTPML